MKTIGVVGCGFVGTAVAKGMCHAFQVYGVDKKDPGLLKKWCGLDDHVVSAGGNDSLEELIERVDGPIFICVPTPMRPNGSCDTTIVQSVISGIDSLALVAKRQIVVVIKSTVPPGTTDRLNGQFHHVHVCFNPEFLREATAVEDFKNQDRIILGGPRSGTNILKQMYQHAYPDVPTTKTHSTIAEMVKYVTNCFLATKVSFANEVYQLCEALEIDYDKVVEYATKDKRLGISHWAVPGPDGHYGFGLTCFPKDLNALMYKAGELGVEPTIMQAAWRKNLEVRPEKDWEQMKGRAVSE